MTGKLFFISDCVEIAIFFNPANTLLSLILTVQKLLKLNAVYVKEHDG